MSKRSALEWLRDQPPVVFIGLGILAAAVLLSLFSHEARDDDPLILDRDRVEFAAPGVATWQVSTIEYAGCEYVLARQGATVVSLVHRPTCLFCAHPGLRGKPKATPAPIKPAISRGGSSRLASHSSLVPPPSR